MNLLRDQRGQVLLVIALMMSILVLAAGLAVDGGNAFVTKARLTKAVDAACLAGMKNLSQGQSTATAIATHIFNANYGVNPPAPTITFPTDAYGDQQVKVTATSQVSTTLARLLFPSWTVADTAVATRGRLVMALVLDNTGSLLNNHGATAVKNAVPTFINYFDDTNDHVSLITFGKTVGSTVYTASTVNFAMATNFKSTIVSDVNALSAGGGTFGTGGTYVASWGPPMALADHQIASVPIVGGANIVRVMVYFTDGLVNAVQDTFTCYTDATHSTQVLVNYGGYDTGTTVHTFKASDGTDWCASGDCTFTTGSGRTAQTHIGISRDSAGDLCENPYGTKISNFPSVSLGQTTISRTNVTTEAQYRALQTANTMRAENPGVYVFTIGLGSGVDASTQTFLKKVANDPASPTYNSSLPTGEFFYIADCSSNPSDCTTQLRTAFQTIASKILLRLTQ
jgi:Flp pilus assembly protein TadG